MSESSNSKPKDENSESSPEKTTADIVSEVLNPIDENTESSPELEDENSESSTEKTDENTESSPELEKSEIESKPEEEEEQPPFHEHPRWKQVVKERDEARAEIEVFKGSSEKLENITQFMETNHIEPDQAGEAFSVVAHITNGRYKEALATLTPIVENLQKLTGNILPDDLETKVNEGHLDEDSAYELAQARQNAQTSKMQAQRANENLDHNNIQTQRQEITASVKSFVERLQKSDPDFSKKESLIQDRVRSLIQEKGHPADKKQAHAFIQQAYDEINSQISSFLPNRQNSSVSPKNTKMNSPRQRPASAEEAVLLGLRL